MHVLIGCSSFPDVLEMIVHYRSQPSVFKYVTKDIVEHLHCGVFC